MFRQQKEDEGIRMDMRRFGESIAKARKKRNLTQEELAARIGVTTQAVSKWENGHNLPDIENVMRIAEITNTPYAHLFGAAADPVDHRSMNIRARIFNEDNMFTRMRALTLAEGLTETYRALSFMRRQHVGQFRKQARYSTELIQYIAHPLTMACQAHAAGIRDDALLSAILLHDVVEDTGVSAEELPFSGEVRTIVDLVSFSVPEGQTKAEAKKAYYERIRNNAKACVVKLLDRSNNVSTMAGSFPRGRMVEYIEETEQYILPLASVLKNEYPEYSDLAFLSKYQILSVLETIKYLITE